MVLCKKIKFVSLLFFLFSLVYAEIPQPLLAGSEIDYPPYCFVNEQGEPAGFSIDLLNSVLNVMNLDVQYTVDKWELVKESLALGDIHVLPLVGRTPDREDIFDFTFPYLKRYGTVVVRKGTFHPRSYADLEGLKLGTLKGDNAEEFILSHPLSIQLTSTETFYEALRLLSEGNLDGVVIQRFLAIKMIQDGGFDNLFVEPKVEGMFQQSFCFAVQEGNKELLDILNEGLAIVMANGIFDQLQNKWFYPDGRERRYENMIHIGGDNSYPPYEFINKEGKPEGFNVDLSRAIAKELGYDVSIELKNWNDTKEALYSGEIDLVQGLFFSPKRAIDITFSQPHSIINHGIFYREGNRPIENMDELSNPAIIVMRGDIMEEYARDRGWGDNLIYVETLEKGFMDLSRGEGDVLLSALIPGLALIDKLNLENIEMIPLDGVSNEYGYGALHENRQLVLKFSEGLSRIIASGEYREIYKKWLGSYDRSFITSEIFRRYVFPISGFLLFFTILFFLWGFFSNRKVRERTVQIEDQQKELEKQRDLIMEQNKSLEYILDDIMGGFWDWDIENNTEYLSPGFKAMFGYEDHELPNVPESWQKIIFQEDLPGVLDVFDLHCQSKGQIPFYNKVRYHHKSGSTIWVICAGRIVEWAESGSPKRMIGCHVDITQLVYTEIELKKSKDYYKSLIDNMNSGLAVYSPDKGGSDFLLTHINSYAELLFGSIHEMGKLISDSFLNSQDSELLDGMKECLKTGNPLIIPKKSYIKGDKEYLLECHIFQLPQNRIALLFENREMQHELENRLHQSEKMEALGQLSGGIAHDFNNILTAISGFSELSQDLCEPESTQHGYLQQILNSTQRAQKLVSQILSFSRNRTATLNPIFIKEDMDESLSLLRASLPSSVVINCDLEKENYPVMGDQTKLQEIIINIANNAAQSMDYKGELNIILRNFNSPNELLGTIGKTPAGDYTELVVMDSGCGIDVKTLPHIFDPFFTTKDIGRGTGMGLAVVYGIVKEFSGNIIVHSTINKGTEIRIYLPQIKDIERINEANTGK
jgi:PAS domain S-box-containing protein